MLTPMDDTLWHQLPTTFDHVWTSDPRFFDRYWFACYARDREISFQMTMGVYRNMNVADGGAIVIVDGKQYNVRVSRSLNRDAQASCGPLSVTPTKPLHELVLRIEPGEHAVSGEIVWTCIAPAREEHPHFQRQRGRIAQEYQRFTQLGTARGRLVINGRRIEVDDWWACRDHSWGVRQGMAIREPVTGPKTSLSDKGHVHAFLYFATDRYLGSVNIQRRGDDPGHPTGVVTDRQTGAERELVGLDLSIEFFEGTRRFRNARLDARFEDGFLLSLDSDAFGPSVAMQGLGYSGGYRDRGGPGVWRGEEFLEHDVWDVSGIAKVIAEDGTETEPWHRVQPSRVIATDSDGAVSEGMGSMTLTVSGRLPDYLTSN